MNARHNKALDQLSDAQFRDIGPCLQLVSLLQGQVLFGPGDRIDSAFFPVNALIAVANELEEGVSLDMALVGADSVIGLRGLFQPVCAYRVHVAQTGLAYKVPLALLRRHFQVSLWLQNLYMQASDKILGQIASEASCARFHDVTQRVARWLISRSEYTARPCLETTHLVIAESLGVRREAVTHALLKLPGIEHSRSHIDIVDRGALQASACACHRRLRETLSGQLQLPFHDLPPQPAAALDGHEARPAANNC
jgi:CRP-like cAMP-binding protein